MPECSNSRFEHPADCVYVFNLKYVLMICQLTLNGIKPDTVVEIH
jgi:hypothetical protein